MAQPPLDARRRRGHPVGVLTPDEQRRRLHPRRRDPDVSMASSAAGLRDCLLLDRVELGLLDRARVEQGPLLARSTRHQAPRQCSLLLEPRPPQAATVISVGAARSGTAKRTASSEAFYVSRLGSSG